MGLRAALFDVGGTLIESPELDPFREDVLAAMRREFGDVAWAETLYRSDIRRPPVDEPHRQETLAWYRAWFNEHEIAITDADLGRLRRCFAAPLPKSFHLTTGAEEALRWCDRIGLRVVLVTNTLSTDEADIWRDWRALGFGEVIDAVVSSTSVGWQKPHPEIFKHALQSARSSPADSFMVGDEMATDVAGAKALGIRAIWKRSRYMSDGVTPDAEISTLEELPDLVARWR